MASVNSAAEPSREANHDHHNQHHQNQNPENQDPENQDQESTLSVQGAFALIVHRAVVHLRHGSVQEQRLRLPQRSLRTNVYRG
jgi:hypothetical protein